MNPTVLTIATTTSALGVGLLVGKLHERNKAGGTKHLERDYFALRSIINARSLPARDGRRAPAYLSSAVEHAGHLYDFDVPAGARHVSTPRATNIGTWSRPACVRCSGPKRFSQNTQTWTCDWCTS